MQSFPGEESVCQDATLGSYDSSFETTYDEGAELLELGDVSIWEQATSYPYTSGRCPSKKQRSCPARVLQQVCILSLGHSECDSYIGRWGV